MNRPVTLGESEQLVLLSILRLGENAYGVSIRTEIAERTGRQISPGALYTTLDRLEEKAIVRSFVGEATAQRGGRAKRYYVLTAKGRRAIVSAQQAFRNMLEGLDLLGVYYA